MVTEDLTNKWADSCVGMQMDVCYPVLTRLSPICLALQSLQNHYHPDVAKAAAVLNQSLSEMEDDISGLLELSAYEVVLLCLCE